MAARLQPWWKTSKVLSLQKMQEPHLDQGHCSFLLPEQPQEGVRSGVGVEAVEKVQLVGG